MFYALEKQEFCPKCKRNGEKNKMYETSESYINYAKKIVWEIYYRCSKCGWYKKKVDK